MCRFLFEDLVLEGKGRKLNERNEYTMFGGNTKYVPFIFGKVEERMLNYSGFEGVCSWCLWSVSW